MKQNEEQPTPRSNQQNRALHKWAKQISDAYMERGVTVQDLITKFTMETYVTPGVVKELIIKTALQRMFQKESTTQIEKNSDEIDKIVDVVTKFNAKVNPDIGYIPWPSTCEKHDVVECEECGQLA